MTKILAAITGVGGYVPDDILSNAYLEKMVDTTDEWITSRTGIKERRILRSPRKATSDMGVEVLRQILAKTNTVIIICKALMPHMISLSAFDNPTSNQ